MLLQKLIFCEICLFSKSTFICCFIFSGSLALAVFTFDELLSLIC